MATVYRGRAEFAGCAMVLDVILWADDAIQDATLTQQYEVEEIKDSRGATIAKQASNESHDLEVNMKLIGDTKANARAINSVAAGGFLPPLQSVAISQPSSGDQMPGSFIGTWQCKPGQKISAKNAACGDLSLPLMKWADATQNTLLNTTPS
jgi:hypothetical protein